MFDPTLCYLARLKYSDWYKRPFYSTTLTLTFEDESANERLVMNDPTHQQADDAPQARLYFGDGEEDYQNSDQFAYIIADPNYKGESRILPVPLYEKAKLKLTKKATETSKTSKQLD